MNGNLCESEKSLYHLVDDSVELQYMYGVAMRSWEPHRNTEWRILPYTTIVTTGEQDGEYTAEIKEKGVIRIPASSVYVIPSGTAFKLELKKPAYLGNAHIAFTILGHIDILSFFDFPRLIEAPASLAISKIVDELAACAPKKEEASVELSHMIHMKSMAFQLLDQLAEQAGQRDAMGSRLAEINRIQAVLDYINMHMSEKISRKVLADLVNLSETHFHYVFKEVMGTSPMNYLMMQRLQEAQKRLLATDDCVTRIAEGVGIDNVSYFSKLFKNKFHVSPLKYRQMKKSDLGL